MTHPSGTARSLWRSRPMAGGSSRGQPAAGPGTGRPGSACARSSARMARTRSRWPTAGRLLITELAGMATGRARSRPAGSSPARRRRSRWSNPDSARRSPGTRPRYRAGVAAARAALERGSAREAATMIEEVRGLPGYERNPSSSTSTAGWVGGAGGWGWRKRGTRAHSRADDEEVSSIAIDRTGRWVASGYRDGGVMLRDMEACEPTLDRRCDRRWGRLDRHIAGRSPGGLRRLRQAGAGLGSGDQDRRSLWRATRGG